MHYSWLIYDPSFQISRHKRTIIKFIFQCSHQLKLKLYGHFKGNYTRQLQEMLTPFTWGYLRFHPRLMYCLHLLKKIGQIFPWNGRRAPIFLVTALKDKFYFIILFTSYSVWFFSYRKTILIISQLFIFSQYITTFSLVHTTCNRMFFCMFTSLFILVRDRAELPTLLTNNQIVLVLKPSSHTFKQNWQIVF